MKTIKLQLLILLIPISINLCAQDIQRFLGIYHLKGVCESQEGNVFPDERGVIITEGIESDLLINIGASAGFNDFKVFVSGDSLFIPSQWWDNFDETQASFQGKGRIENDSLFLYYKTGGTFGTFECECKGKKTSSANVLYPLPTDENIVYFDVINQLIVLDETLQHQSLTFELIDTLGKIVLKKTNVDSNAISVVNIPNGVYLYRLLQNKRTVFRGKILKNR